MIRRGGDWFRRWFTDTQLPDYDLPDPDLSAYDHGLGTLAVDDKIRGYLASVRWEMSFPVRQWWPWFVVVWADSRKELPFEDYGPKWYTVRELDAGRFRHYDEHGVQPQTYEFAWLPTNQAAIKWAELALTDDDF